MTVDGWETETLEPLRQRPEWPGHDDAGAHVRFLRSQESVPEQHADSLGLTARVAADSGRLLYLASAGPDAGCDRLVVDDVTLTDGALSIDAHVACDSEMAAQVITYPASALWVPDITADRATASITDGWEQSHTVEATVERE